ncbi:MAG: MoaD/ThiS family protein [Spirosomataceae bacterium]
MATIHIALFGITRDIVGSKQLTVQLEHPTVEGLLTELQTTYPPLKQIRSLLVAVNSDYATAQQPLSETDEIALIPPVSGG